MAKESRLLSFFNEFDKRFRTLEESCNNNASRVEFLIINNTQIRADAFWLYDAYSRFRDLRTKAPFLKDIPRWFVDREKAFTDKWWPHIETICGDLDRRALVVELTVAMGMSDESELQGIPATEISKRENPRFFRSCLGVRTIRLAMDMVQTRLITLSRTSGKNINWLTRNRGITTTNRCVRLWRLGSIFVKRSKLISRA